MTLPVASTTEVILALPSLPVDDITLNVSPTLNNLPPLVILILVNEPTILGAFSIRPSSLINSPVWKLPTTLDKKANVTLLPFITLVITDSTNAVAAELEPITSLPIKFLVLSDGDSSKYDGLLNEL